jgi:hypothetical protein
MHMHCLCCCLLLQPLLQAAGAGASSLRLTRQLIGNHDEITDLAFLYSGSSSSGAADTAAAATAAAADGSSMHGLTLQAGEPRRLAVATNSHDIRLFDLSDASCVGGCVGHRDIVLCLDTVQPAAGAAAFGSCCVGTVGPQQLGRCSVECEVCI